MSSSTRNRLKMHIVDFLCTWVLILHHFPPIYDFPFFQKFRKISVRRCFPALHCTPRSHIMTISLQFVSSSTRNRLKMPNFGFPCTRAIISHRFPPFYDFSKNSENFKTFRSGAHPAHQPKLAPTIILQALPSANSAPSKLENCSISFPKTMRDRYRI